MRCSTTSLVLAAFAVSEAIAGPVHAHSHQNFHEKKDLTNVKWDELDWENMGVDWASAYAAGKNTPTTVAPAEATPSPSFAAEGAAPASTLTSTSSSSDSSTGLTSSSVSLWKNLVGASNERTSFGQSTQTRGREVGYVSNVGNPEGSNMIKVASTDGHDFTNEYINTSGAPMTVVIWNKSASPGLSNPDAADANLGASIAPDHPALTFALAPGQSQIVAFQDQSVIGWAQATDKRVASGGFDTTWGEVQFNHTGSGYDVSMIQNTNGNNYNMDISSLEASNCHSTKYANMWISDVKFVGSGSCYVSQSVAHLTTKMGGTS